MPSFRTPPYQASHLAWYKQIAQLNFWEELICQHLACMVSKRRHFAPSTNGRLAQRDRMGRAEEAFYDDTKQFC